MRLAAGFFIKLCQRNHSTFITWILNR
jgi:hypothetical protein